MKYVLFVCTHNAGRSQMAQAFFERHGPDDIRAESAGQQPGREVGPEVVAAMGDVGIDLSGRRPQKLTVEMQLHADLSKEFEGRRSEAEIRACTDAILSDSDDAPARSFVMNLAHRRSRECLAKEQCDALTTA